MSFVRSGPLKSARLKHHPRELRSMTFPGGICYRQIAKKIFFFVENFHQMFFYHDRENWISLKCIGHQGMFISVSVSTLDNPISDFYSSVLSLTCIAAGGCGIMEEEPAGGSMSSSKSKPLVATPLTPFTTPLTPRPALRSLPDLEGYL